MDSGLFSVRQDKAIFYVNGRSGKTYYLSTPIRDLDESEHAYSTVVFLESHSLLQLWKNDLGGSQQELACGDEAVWRNDYKFHHAEEGFSSGIDNPVPLANPECEMADGGLPYISFTDGITRTIWLLANGAKSFPILTTSKSADNLSEYVNLTAPVLKQSHYQYLTPVIFHEWCNHPATFRLV